MITWFILFTIFLVITLLESNKSLIHYVMRICCWHLMQ
uniref:Uncharacterized protein n=1 Tax=Rhizophora mucronata TaxID=61149 RepID=A0A2P2IQQ9_RHIMU